VTRPVNDSPSRSATASRDIVVIGAGAAGLMAAAVAAARGLDVELLEHNREPGMKILISGGGRCNFTNLDVRPDRFVSRNPHFAKSALARFTQHDFIAMVDEAGIAWYEKTLGQLFCDGDRSARKIVDMLMHRCRSAGAKVRTGVGVKAVRGHAPFEVLTDAGPLTARAVIVACGGSAIPKLGATDTALQIARDYGLGVVDVRPALVPLTLGGADLEMASMLAGVAFPVRASAGRQVFDEAALFTHRGLSGPAILQVSSYWRPGQPIQLDLSGANPAMPVLTERKRSVGGREPATVLGEALPQRLAHALAERLLPRRRLADIRDEDLRRVDALLSEWVLNPVGTEGYAKAEVMAGGVDTADLSSRTLEARSLKGLHFVGEALDVTGWLGGYNFQWAWSSGWVAGMSVMAA